MEDWAQLMFLVLPSGVLQHGKGKWTIEISYFPNQISIQKEDFPASHV